MSFVSNALACTLKSILTIYFHIEYMTALREQFSWPLALQCILAYHFNKPSDGTTVRIVVSHAAGPGLIPGWNFLSVRECKPRASSDRCPCPGL